jgi:hypothetical protein
LNSALYVCTWHDEKNYQTNNNGQSLSPYFLNPASDQRVVVASKGNPGSSERDTVGPALWCSRQDMPERFPPYQTCHRRIQEWTRSGLIRRTLDSLARDPLERGGFDLAECYIDATFMIAKKGASGLEKPSGARVRSSWRWQTALVFLAPCTLRLLRRTKSPLFTILSKKGFFDLDLFAWLVIVPTTAIR